MRLLLDTHVLLWGLEDVDRLHGIELDAISAPGNTVYFSPVNLWEIAIKVGKGQITVRSDFMIRVQAEQALRLLPIKLDHVWRVQDLPDHHGDPFDRLLISQAIVERLTLVTRDRAVKRYGVKVLGAD